MNNGNFFSFEGIDYCGKSTQIKLVADYLNAQDMPVVVGVEPGSTALGQVLRKILKSPKSVYRVCNREYKFDSDFMQINPDEPRTAQAEMLLFLAARSEFVDKFVRPNLEREVTVLADRFADSTRAYQGGGRFNSDPAMISAINTLNELVINSHWPRKTFILDIPYEVMMKRAETRAQKKDYIESAGEAFFQRVIREYRAIARENPQRVVLIDGSQPAEVIFNEGILPYIAQLCLK